MAYKFQLGKAKLSGSIELTQQLKVASGGLSITGSVALDAGEINTAELADLSVTVDKLGAEAVETAKIKALNVTAAKLAVDAVETAKIKDGAVTNVKLAFNTISGKQLGTNLDSLSAAVNGGLSTFTYDGSGAIAISLSASVAGDGLGYSSGVISVQATGVVEVYSDKLRINQSLAGQGLGTAVDATAGLTKLNVTYGSGSNTAVQGNSSWSITGGNGLTGDASGVLGSGISSTLAVGAGDGITVSANAVSVQLSSSNALSLDAGGVDLRGTIAGSRIFSNDLTVEGNLYVNGGTFSASVGTLLIQDSNIVIADGAPALSASQGFTIGGGAGFATFQVGDGSSTNTAFVSSLELKASKFIGAVEGAVAETVETLSTSAVAAASIVLCDAVSAGFTVTLPSAVGKSGQFIKVKKIDNTENAVVIDANGSETIDGVLTVTIDSPFAGLMLVSNNSNWFIF